MKIRFEPEIPLVVITLYEKNDHAKHRHQYIPFCLFSLFQQITHLYVQVPRLVVVGGRWVWIQKMNKTEALPSWGLESRKINRYIEALAQNRPAGRSYIPYREDSGCGG